MVSTLMKLKIAVGALGGWLMAGCAVNVTPADSPRPPVSQAEALAQVQLKFEKQLDEQIAKEGASTQRRDQVTQKLGALLAKSGTVDNLRCSAAICRLETTHSSEALYSKFVKAALFGPAAMWHGAFTITTARAAPGGPHDAKWKSVIFLGADPGIKVPQPDNCESGCPAVDTRDGPP